MRELRGWLFDVFTHPRDEVVVWFIGEDGERYRFRMHFPLSFYATGEHTQLRSLWQFLKHQPLAVKLERVQRKDLYSVEHDCLAIQVMNASLQRRIFNAAYRAFPDLDYYNSNISLPIQFHNHFKLFPLAFCQVQLEDGDRIADIHSLASPWSLDMALPHLRILAIKPDTDPGRINPQHIELSYEGRVEQLATQQPVELLQTINARINSYDPDIIASRYGDKWLFPYLFSLAKEHGLPFNPNREPGQRPIQVEESTFSSYGRLVHRDRQTLLLGRIHLDPENSMSFKDFGFLGTYELARVTGLPLQNAARRSPGGGFTAMQIRAALDREILLPLNKKRHEKFKSALELVEADNGGLVYQPLIGLHEKVAGIDFFSMFPSIMSAWNISPETVNTYGEHTRFVPGINRPISQDQRGVVPTVLEPILVKRRHSKSQLKHLNEEDEQYGPMKTMTETLKWLGWVSFGYQGFSGNRIGSIEAHESINGVSRDLLLHAKEAAEEQGFKVIHMYVDSLFIKKVGCEAESDFDAVIEEMNRRTGLMLELEGIFNWIIFLPSKTDEDLPIPNCFFGAYQNGETKCRGIMARRGDTPIFVVESQMRAIRLMARAEDAATLRKLLPRLVHFLKQKYQQLANEKVAVRELVISQRLGRELEDYKALSPVGRAAQQLALAGKQPRAGQRVDYLRVIAKGDVLAWALSSSQQHILLDFAWYQQAFLRAAQELVQCFGITKETLELWLQDQESYFRPEDYVNGSNQELPLLILNLPPGTPPVAD